MGRMTANKFILLNTHRSGTRLFFDTLGGDAQVQRHTRAFDLTTVLERFMFDRRTSPFYRFRTASTRRRIDYVLRRKDVINDFLAELCTSSADVQAVGIRLLYEQADKHPEILEWAIENRVPIVHLIRKNVLKAIVYTEASLKRGLLHATTRNEPVTSLYLPPSRLKAQLARLTRHIAKYRAMLEHAQVLEVSYESLVAEREAQTRRITAFLSIRQLPTPTTAVAKADPGSLEGMIENYREVEQALNGTALKKYLHEHP